MPVQHLGPRPQRKLYSACVPNRRDESREQEQGGAIVPLLYRDSSRRPMPHRMQRRMSLPASADERAQNIAAHQRVLEQLFLEPRRGRALNARRRGLPLGFASATGIDLHRPTHIRLHRRSFEPFLRELCEDVVAMLSNGNDAMAKAMADAVKAHFSDLPSCTTNPYVLWDDDLEKAFADLVID